MTAASDQVGVVVIGRNEGERLRSCLTSVCGDSRPVIYVDSGSTDGSLELAARLGAVVINLDLASKFTAARARNEGMRKILEVCSDVRFVLYVDGDCEVVADWIESALQCMRSNPDVVVVCGRRRERFPAATIYNRLCDLEWDTPIGDALACGGDALFRVSALQAVGGYRNELIAGEEPELCFRLRQAGGRIQRIDCEMTLHDAAMISFRQWWTRAVRAGHAYAEGHWLTRRLPCPLWRRENRSTWFWAVIVPILAIAPIYWTRGWSLLLVTTYAVLWLRIFGRAARKWGIRDGAIYSAACVVAKFAHLVGILKFHRNRLLGRTSTLIEYKTHSHAAGAST